eukprot:5012062-Pyramimonas_sp.AAC.1
MQLVLPDVLSQECTVVPDIHDLLIRYSIDIFMMAHSTWQISAFRVQNGKQKPSAVLTESPA